MKITYTYIDALNEVLSTCTLSDQCEDKLIALRETIAKRNASKSSAGKPTKTQRENVEVKERIREFLTHTLQGVRCGDIATACGISGQKCSALLSQMVKAGEVVKREEKRVALFLLPENDCTREDVE